MTLSFTGRLDDVVSSGEGHDLAKIFKTYSRRVIGLCQHLLRDRDLAEDAASDVFLRLRDAIASYDGSVPLERWLLRVTANHCIDLLRRRQLERRWMVAEEAPVDPPSGEASPLTLLLLKERQGAVARAVEGLSDGYRLPLILRYHAGLSYDEIAAELDLEKTQVAGRIFRAKQILREWLKEIQ